MERQKEIRDFLAKKSFEIAYALVRLAEGAGKGVFGERFENAGLILVESAIWVDRERITAASRLVEYLIRLGAESKKISLRNMEIVLKEIEVLNSAANQMERSDVLQDTDIAGLFVEKRQKIRQNRKNPAKMEAIAEDAPGIPPEQELTMPAIEEIDPAMERINPATIAGSLSAGIRQSMIIDRIRQTDSCGFKDIQEALPETSERTIRYDLENLVKSGIIERLGTGPGTLYRVRRSYEAA